MSNDHQAVGLMSLPSETRLQILSYLLKRSSTANWLDARQRYNAWKSISRANPQLRIEANDVYFRDAQWRLDCLWRLPSPPRMCNDWFQIAAGQNPELLPLQVRHLLRCLYVCITVEEDWSRSSERDGVAHPARSLNDELTKGSGGWLKPLKSLPQQGYTGLERLRVGIKGQFDGCPCVYARLREGLAEVKEVTERLEIDWSSCSVSNIQGCGKQGGCDIDVFHWQFDTAGGMTIDHLE